MNINISCPINSTGYGISSWNILKNLCKLDTNIAYFPIGQPSASTQEDYDLIVKLYQNSQSFDIHAPYIKIWHQFDLANHVGKGKYFAFPFFELDCFNSLETNHLKVPDSIIVTSNWAKNIVVNTVQHNSVFVVPLGVDRDIFNPTLYQENIKDKYIFLNIGKWEVRKGHDLLLELFQKAFPNETDVELQILASETTNNYSKPEEIKQWKNMYAQDSRIKLLPSAKNHQEIAQIIANSDCGLYPSRAEGWNLEALETMSMNKPLIITNYSAHTEFCHAENSFLIDIYEKEPAYDGKAFVGQGNWAKIDNYQKDQIINYMRYVYKNRIKNNPSGELTANKFSWSNSANMLFGCIS